LEVVEEIPDPLLLSFYLKEIDVKTAMQVFVPDTKASDLPDFVNKIKLTEVSFYWAELPVIVPDGSIAQPGLRFSGNLQILDFKAHAALKIDQNTGISGEFEMSPIHFQHILSITGKGKGVYRKEKNGKSIPLSVKPDKNAAALSKVEIVPPGGPYFQFQSTHSPYLRMSLEVSFLDLLHEEIEALVTDDSIQFHLHYDLGGVVSTDMAFALSKEGFAVHAAFGIHLKADIGPIEILGIDFGHLHIDTGFDISMDVSATLDKFDMRLNGEFEFEGARFTFPELHLGFSPKSLEELPELIIQQISDHASDIFADLFDEAGKFIEDAGKEIAELAEKGAEAVADVAKAAEAEAEEIVKDAGKAVGDAAAAAKAEVEEIGKEAKKLLDDAGAEAEKLEKEAEAAVAEVGEKIGEIAEAAEKEIEHIGQAIADEAKQILEDVGELADEAAEAVKDIAKKVGEEAERIFDGAKEAAKATLKAAGEAVEAIGKEAEKLWNEAAHLAEEIAEAARRAAEAVANAAKSAWHALSKY